MLEKDEKKKSTRKGIAIDDSELEREAKRVERMKAKYLKELEENMKKKK